MVIKGGIKATGNLISYTHGITTANSIIAEQGKIMLQYIISYYGDIKAREDIVSKRGDVLAENVFSEKGIIENNNTIFWT